MNKIYKIGFINSGTYFLKEGDIVEEFFENGEMALIKWLRIKNNGNIILEIRKNAIEQIQYES